MTNQKSPITEKELKNAIALSIGSESVLLSSIVWFFLGALGFHRMYLGKVASGIMMATFTLIGLMTVGIIIGLIPLVIVFIWWVDLPL